MPIFHYCFRCREGADNSKALPALPAKANIGIWWILSPQRNGAKKLHCLFSPKSLTLVECSLLKTSCPMKALSVHICEWILLTIVKSSSVAEDLKVLADGRKYNYVLNFTKWKDTVTKLKKKKKKKLYRYL